jgi:hypothetical protein
MLKLTVVKPYIYGDSVNMLRVDSHHCAGTCFCTYADKDLRPYVCHNGTVGSMSEITDLCHDIDWIELSELLRNWRKHAGS